MTKEIDIIIVQLPGDQQASIALEDAPQGGCLERNATDRKRNLAKNQERK